METNNKEYKYNCEKCNFKCNTKARWEAHITTELHKTGQRKKRSDFKEHLIVLYLSGGFF